MNSNPYSSSITLNNALTQYFISDVDIIIGVNATNDLGFTGSDTIRIRILGSQSEEI